MIKIIFEEVDCESNKTSAYHQLRYCVCCLTLQFHLYVLLSKMP